MADDGHAPDQAREGAKRHEKAAVAKGLFSALTGAIGLIANLSAFLSASARNRTETVGYSLAAVICLVVVFLCYAYGRRLKRLPVKLKPGALAAGLVVMLAICAVAGYLTGRDKPASPPAAGAATAATVTTGPATTGPPGVRSGTPAGSFTSPFPGESDIPPSSFVTTAGWARNIPQSDTLWLFLYVASVGKYYMSDPGCVVLTGTQWKCRIYIGGSGQSGERFTLWLAALGPQSVQVLNTSPDEQLSGFSTMKLAADTTPLASVTFTVNGP